MNVLTTNERPEVPREAILDVVEQKKTRFNPQKIILFGSYARGTQGPGSDIDLLVVMPLEKKPLRQAIEILQNIDYHFGLDLIVRSPEASMRRVKLGDFFLQEAVEQGVLLYESDH